MKVPTIVAITLPSIKLVAFIWVTELASAIWAVSPSFPVYTHFYMPVPASISISTWSFPEIPTVFFFPIHESFLISVYILNISLIGVNIVSTDIFYKKEFSHDTSNNEFSHDRPDKSSWSKASWGNLRPAEVIWGQLQFPKLRIKCGVAADSMYGKSL